MPLRDAQIHTRHADPRTIEHCDRARGNLDGHAVHFLTALCRRYLNVAFPVQRNDHQTQMPWYRRSTMGRWR